MNHIYSIMQEFMQTYFVQKPNSKCVRCVAREVLEYSAKHFRHQCRLQSALFTLDATPAAHGQETVGFSVFCAVVHLCILCTTTSMWSAGSDVQCLPKSTSAFSLYFLQCVFYIFTLSCCLKTMCRTSAASIKWTQNQLYHAKCIREAQRNKRTKR